MAKRAAAVLAVLVVTAACGQDTGGGASAPDLEIERRTGYAVVVDETAEGLVIGFSLDRDATSGEAFDVSQALWRIEDGAWNEPPVTCLGRGQRIEVGVTSVQNETRPGLLTEHVVWVSCLSPVDE
jgi:hypothetical protein